ncbi:MAG: hypothetical protein AVDCRST_MAG56-5177 [uncultured Cytophagales bacterium]|uniref:Uncharacterized protein n=1 Tax=uncultured Cytophagales bacterium TaxID=158755 RepID=A0A6J4K5H4_9SPHI|nr:MAG: hypothetical protein AVDCRST_MAG56-5177 [uncultured Cytophagales bacterium]
MGVAVRTRPAEPTFPRGDRKPVSAQKPRPGARWFVLQNQFIAIVPASSPKNPPAAPPGFSNII